MATYISPSGTTNFTGSLNVADSTSLNNSEAATTLLTTSFGNSTAFTPGAITVDGIGVKVAQVYTPTSGTMTVQLAQGGTLVAGTAVTINATDLPVTPQAVLSGTYYQSYWVFFKFASPVTLAAATAYTVQAKTSVSTIVLLNCSATTNYSRFLRTTSTGTMAAGDTLLVCGDFTAANTSSTNTITHNNTATTQFASVEVGAAGAWTWGNSASTNYYCSMTGNMIIGAGTLTVPSMPSTSTATFQFPQTGGAAGSLVQFRYTSVIRITGATKSNTATTLNANSAVSATSITTAVSTGWASGDDIVIASTTQTPGQTERVTMTGAASGTSVPVPALTYAHGGVAPIVAEVCNLTRNVIFIGASTTNTFAVQVWSQDYQITYTQFSNFGSGTVYKTGFGVASVIGTNGNKVDYCVFKDMHTSGVALVFNMTNTTDYFSSTGCIAHGGATHIYTNTSAAGTHNSISNFYSFSTNAAALAINDPGFTYNGLTVVSSAGTSSATSSVNRTSLWMTNLTWHSNSNYLNPTIAGASSAALILLSNVTSWRNNYGMVFNGAIQNATIDNFVCFGNSISNVYFGSTYANAYFTNFNLQAGTTQTCPVGMTFATSNAFGAYIDNLLCGTVTTHATADINITGAANGSFLYRNPNFGSSTFMSGQTTLAPGSSLTFQKYNGSAGVNKVYYPSGTANSDTAIYPPGTTVSQRVTPNSASNKVQSGSFIIPVATSASFTVTVQVRTSNTGSGDAATYNGNPPQLYVRSNPAAGSSTYQYAVLAATAVSSPGNWQTLTYTSTASADNTALEFYIIGDGTTGWFNWGLVTVA